MVRWALGSFGVALMAALFGLLRIATAAAGIACLLFFMFILFSLVGKLMRRGRRISAISISHGAKARGIRRRVAAFRSGMRRTAA
jgi:uncharacterized membrane protein YtjA (UPF0391 family)